MHKTLTISYRHEGGWPGDEDGGRWTEIGSRSYSLSLNPGSGYKIVIEISKHNDSWPALEEQEVIEFAMPIDWHVDTHLVESLPTGIHEDRELEAMWLELFKRLSGFESFSSTWLWNSYQGKYKTFSNSTLKVNNGCLKYIDEFTSEEPSEQPRKTQILDLRDDAPRDWPNQFDPEFMRLIREERFRLEQWVYEDDEGNIFYNSPTEQEIISKIKALKLQKSNDLLQDLLSGLRHHLKTGLEGARQQWDFLEGDFWMHIRLLAKLESKIG